MNDYKMLSHAPQMAIEIKGSFCNFLHQAFNLGQSSDVFSCLTGSPMFPGKPQYPSNPFSPGSPAGPCLPQGPGGPGGPTMPGGPSHPGCPGLPPAPCIPLLPVVKKNVGNQKVQCGQSRSVTQNLQSIVGNEDSTLFIEISKELTDTQRVLVSVHNFLLHNNCTKSSLLTGPLDCLC